MNTFVHPYLSIYEIIIFTSLKTLFLLTTFILVYILEVYIQILDIPIVYVIFVLPYFFIFSTLSLLIHLMFTTQGSYLFIFYLYLIIILIVFYVLYFVLYFMCICGLTNVYRNKHYT